MSGLLQQGLERRKRGIRHVDPKVDFGKGLAMVNAEGHGAQPPLVTARFRTSPERSKQGRCEGRFRQNVAIGIHHIGQNSLAGEHIAGNGHAFAQ